MANNTAQTPSRLDRLWQFLQADPNNASLLRDIAKEGLSTGRFDEAVKALDQLQDIGQSDANDEAAAIHALVKLGQIGEAVERGELALQHWPQDEAICVETARALLNAKRYDEVNRLCERSFEDSTVAQLAAEFALQALWHLGELDKALTLSTASIERFPGNARILALHSSILYDKGLMADAFAAAHQAYALSPAHAYTALHVLASERLVQQDIPGALKLVDEAQHINTNDGRIWLLKGSAHMMTGQHDKAIADLQRALTLFPNHPGTHLTLAWLYISLQDLDQAEAAVHNAIEASPAFAESHGTMAVVLAMKGEQKEAQQSIRRAHLLDKNGFAARYAEAVLSGHTLQSVPEIYKELALRVKL
jgi:tetratricopeptide (TPR) repeat protein